MRRSRFSPNLIFKDAYNEVVPSLRKAFPKMDPNNPEYDFGEIYNVRSAFRDLVDNTLKQNGFEDGVRQNTRSEKYKAMVRIAISLVTPELVKREMDRVD